MPRSGNGEIIIHSAEYDSIKINTPFRSRNIGFEARNRDSTRKNEKACRIEKVCKVPDMLNEKQDARQ